MLTRRKWLQGVSASAVSLSLSSPLLARPRGTAILSAFNGGKSQVNLAFLNNGGDYPFLNCMKTANSWSFLNNASAPVTPDILDVNGYPTTIVNTGVFTIFFVPTQAERPGNYAITWDGTGTIFCGMNNTLVAGSKTSSGGAGRYVFSTTDSRFSVGISSIGSPAITNMKVFWLGPGATTGGDEALYNSGQVFGVLFKQRLIEANYGVIRFLDWQIGNTTNQTFWNTRMPTGYVFYGADERRLSIYAGTTTNSGNAYSASVPGTLIHTSTGLTWNNGDAPNHGDLVTVTYNADATQSGTCSLQVGTGGSSSAINILNASAGALAGSTYPVGNIGAPNGFASMGTHMYDATLNAWIKSGGSTSGGSVGILNGVPPELMVQLCKEVGAHPYFVSPPLATDPATDYMSSLAGYCHTYAPANAPYMIPRFEGPNELWTHGGGFIQFGYATAKAAAYVAAGVWPSGTGFHDWMGKVMSVLGQGCANVYGIGNIDYPTHPGKYQVLCGVQTATGTSSGSCATSNPRLASTQYVAQSAAPQSPYTQSAAANWVSHVDVAAYISPSERFTCQELIDGYAYSVTNLGNPTAQLALANGYVDTLLGSATIYNLAQNNIYFGNWRTWALGGGGTGIAVNGFCGYEGGYSPDYLTGGWTVGVTAASKASSCVLTLASTSNNPDASSNGATLTGNPSVVGMMVTLASVVGMTQLNNNTTLEAVTFAGGGSANISGANTLLLNQAVAFIPASGGSLPNELTSVLQLTTIGVKSSIPYYVVSAGNPFQVSATRGGSPIIFNSVGASVKIQEGWFINGVGVASGLSANQISLDVDSTSFTTYISGGTLSYTNSQNYSNNLRFAGKNAPNLQGYTYGGATSNYQNFINAGGLFPPQFELSGTTPSNSAFAVLEDIYQSPTPSQQLAIVAFNH